MRFIKLYLLSKQYAPRNAMPRTFIFVEKIFVSLKNLNKYVEMERSQCKTQVEKKRIYSADGGWGIYEIWIEEKNLDEGKLSFPEWGKAIDLKFSNLIMVKFGVLKENFNQECLEPYLIPKDVDYDLLHTYLLAREHKDKQTQIKEDAASPLIWNVQKPQETKEKPKLGLSLSADIKSTSSSKFNKTIRRVRFALGSHSDPNVDTKNIKGNSSPEQPLRPRKDGA